MARILSSVEATGAERRRVRPGDELVSPADIVMDRAFDVAVPPEAVWPWLEQLGKRRAGWYLPRSLERAIPRSRRALRRIEPSFLGLAVGDVIPDYGGRDETFEVVAIEPPHYLVYRSQRGRVFVSWSIELGEVRPGQTRVALRLRLGPVRHKWLARSAGELFDRVTIAGMAAGLRERIVASRD
jgi:hypothetical protein